MDNDKTVQENDIIWNNETEIPDVLSKSNERFSIDILVYNPKTKEHTIGWFDYLEHKWLFLCREANKKFYWRYFIDKLDKHEKNSGKQRNKKPVNH